MATKILKTQMVAACSALLTALLMVAAAAYSQESAPADPAPVPPAPTTGVTAETGQPAPPRVGMPAKSLHALLAEQMEKSKAEGRPRNAALLSIKGKDDGSVEVFDPNGQLVAVYPPGYFSLAGMVSGTVLEERRAVAEAEEATAEESGLTAADAEAERKAAEEREKRKKELEAQQEAEWQAKFAADTTTFVDERKGEVVQAVRIDARKLQEDGTYIQDGRVLQPVRLYNRALGMYQMAVPIESP